MMFWKSIVISLRKGSLPYFNSSFVISFNPRPIGHKVVLLDLLKSLSATFVSSSVRVSNVVPFSSFVRYGFNLKLFMRCFLCCGCSFSKFFLYLLLRFYSIPFEKRIVFFFFLGFYQISFCRVITPIALGPISHGFDIIMLASLFLIVLLFQVWTNNKKK